MYLNFFTNIFIDITNRSVNLAMCKIVLIKLLHLIFKSYPWISPKP